MKNVIVEVIVNNLKDNKYYNQKLIVIRNKKKITILQKLLQEGDRYETDLEHARYLEKLKCVKIIEDKKTSKKEEN